MTAANYVWVEKYRPQTIDECILPDSMKKMFKEFVATGELPNFLLCGTAGTGKTTVAKALCNEMGIEYLMINGSDDGRKLDDFRDRINGFASSVSLTDAKKVVIIDEADYLNRESVQPLLRGFIEEFSANCRFIFTCNFKARIIEPLHSRCSVVEFKVTGSDKQKMAGKFFKRAQDILKNEGIEYDPKAVAELITKFFPDYRRVLNELQRYSVGGVIDSGILANVGEQSYAELFDAMRTKNFTDVRKWVGKNADASSNDIFRTFYDKAVDLFDPNSIPQLVLILSEYDYRSAFVADKELNVMAALTEVMGQLRFK